MRGLWGKFWSRSVITAGFALVTNFIVTGLIFGAAAIYRLGGERGGVLDFAGGGFVSMSWWVNLSLLLPFWIGAEIYIRNSVYGLPKRIFFLFIILFYFALAIFGAFAYRFWMLSRNGERAFYILVLATLWFVSALAACLTTSAAFKLWLMRLPLKFSVSSFD